MGKCHVKTILHNQKATKSCTYMNTTRVLELCEEGQIVTGIKH